MKYDVASLISETAGLDAIGIIDWAVGTFDISRLVLATSFSIEDQVLTDLLLSRQPQARVFTLDTGRHFPETYDIWQKTNDRYAIRIETAFPEASAVQQLHNEFGPNAMYQSRDLRTRCCSIRKVLPLQKVLTTADAWICGLRREQSVTRGTTQPLIWDEGNGLFKICPLADWTQTQVLDYVKSHNLDYSELYQRGFASVGCAPCTRAVKHGESERSGRWWWEEPEHKECGLHNRPKQTGVTHG